uniref:ENTH domain-containing protein n=1 Tax=Kalanchoe fedtschenkoi TaxID=63787 RepID=A0A7N0UQS1_KALFE
MKKALGQTVRDLKREVNKKVLKVPGIERKVLDATSNEAWGPHGSHLADIAQASRNHTEFQMIMGVLWKRLSDTGKNWRHVFKALIVLEYLVANGSERVIDEIKEHAHQISTLSEFQYIDSRGKDQGSNVRRKSQSLVLLVGDKERVQEVRQKASGNRDKYGKQSAYLSSGGYGDRDENRNGYRGDASSRDGDRSDRESETRFSRDGSVDDEHHGRGRNSDDQSNVSRDRSANHADDDGYSSSRGSGVRADDYSKDGRNGRRYSEMNPGDPPSYEETVSDDRSSVHSERGGDPTAPTPTSLPATSSPTHSTTGPRTSEPPVKNSPVNYDEFDPRGSASAPSVTSNVTEMDLLGSFSESFSHDSAKMRTSSSTDSGVDVMMDYGSGATFSTTASNFSQPFEDPFGETPFRATPTDTNLAQTQNPPSIQPTVNQGLEVLSAQSVVPHADTLSNFDYGTPFGYVTYTPSADDQTFTANTQMVPQGFQDQETDILAGILPPTDFMASPATASQETPQALPGQSFQSDNVFGGYHQQSGDPQVTSHFADQTPNQINNDFFPQQGLAAPSQLPTDSQIATHPHSQPNGGDFFHQSGSSVPTSGIPHGQTEPNSHKYEDGGFHQHSLNNMHVTASVSSGPDHGEKNQHGTNGTTSQHLGFPLCSLPMAPQDKKEPDIQSFNEGFFQESASSVPGISHTAPPPSNPHHDGGGFMHGAPQMVPQVQNDQNSHRVHDGPFHQQLTSKAQGTPHIAPVFSYASTAQQNNGGFLPQPGSSHGNPRVNSQQFGSPLIAHQGQTEQSHQTLNSDYLHQPSASMSPGTSHVGPGSSYGPNTQQNTGGFPQQPAPSLVNLPINQQPSMHMPPQGLKEQNSQNYSSGFPHQQSPGAPHILPGSSLPSNGQQNNVGFYQQPGSALGNSPMNPQGQIESTAQNYNGGLFQQKQESHVVPGHSIGATGQYIGGTFLPSGFAQFSPNQNSNGRGSIVSQKGAPNLITSQPSDSSTAGTLALAPQPTKDKFETKSTVWADTLSRGIVNLNISGSKTNPLADIGIDFDAINRKEKRMEKPAATPVVSTVTMGKAMGSGSGIGRAGAGVMRPSASPMMGIGAGPVIGPGSSMAGYGGMNGSQMGGFGSMMNQQQPMGGLGGMSQQQSMGGFGGMSQQQHMGGLGGMNRQQMGSYGGINQQQVGGFGGMNQPSMGMGMGLGPGTGIRPGTGMGHGPGAGMNMGMNLSMGQGSTMQQPSGLPSSYSGGYNPRMGGGYSSQQPYGGGYQ